ncbi:thymidylate kinase [Candidatus Saccharibacteria bacterium]|nr:thymidylate kinase [Candidatus Saccharibacteria bacterium]
MTNQKARIIAIDGPDGSGKTTQVDGLVKKLEDKGLKVLRTRASGGTPIGELLRKVSLSNIERTPEVDLYISLAMHTALGQDMKQKAENYDVIIIDRSPLAILAYNAFGSQLKDVSHAYDACERMLRLWDIDDLLLFSINDNELFTRQQERLKIQPEQTTNYFEMQNNEYKRRMRNGYVKAYEFVNDLAGLPTNLHVINANGSIDQVGATIAKALNL